MGGNSDEGSHKWHYGSDRADGMAWTSYELIDKDAIPVPSIVTKERVRWYMEITGTSFPSTIDALRAKLATELKLIERFGVETHSISIRTEPIAVVADGLPAGDSGPQASDGMIDIKARCPDPGCTVPWHGNVNLDATNVDLDATGGEHAGD